MKKIAFLSRLKIEDDRIEATKDEFENGQLSMFMDEENKQLVVKWKSDIRTNCMYYAYV